MVFRDVVGVEDDRSLSLDVLEVEVLLLELALCFVPSQAKMIEASVLNQT